MAEFKRMSTAPVQPSAAKIGDVPPLDDLLQRATAILTQETSYRRDPAAAASASTPSARGLRADLSAPPRSVAGSVADLGQLREQAIDAIAKLLAAISAPSDQLPMGADFPWNRSGKAANPGNTAYIPLTLDNASDRPVTLVLYSTDLVSDAGYQIPADLISFDPTSQTIPPRSQGAARMNVAIPLQALAGSYSALVQAAGLAASKAVVTLDVL